VKKTLLAFALLGVSLLAGSSLFAATPDKPHPGISLLEGKSAALFLQHPLAAFRVYAFHAGAAALIPFQLDERDRRDRWVLDQGSHPNTDDVPGIFDDNDALVLMNRDLGERGDLSRLPSGATLWGEVRVGPVQEPLGFAYVGIFAQSSQPLASTNMPAHYEEATDRVYAERYTLEFQAPLPKHIAFVEKQGEFGVNTVAGVRAEGEVRLFGGLITLHKTDADIQAELLGYKNGPVRTIRRARYWIPLPLGFRTTGRVDLLFYRNFVEGSALLKINIPPSLVLARGELQTYFDFLRQDGARVLLEGESPSEPIDGHMTAKKQALVGRPARWAALLLPEGKTVVFIVRLTGALQRMEQQFYFDEVAAPSVPGSGRPLFGFQFSRVDRLETGTHRLAVFAYVLDSVNPEDIHTVVNLFLSAPEVEVSLLKASG